MLNAESRFGHYLYSTAYCIWILGLLLGYTIYPITFSFLGNFIVASQYISILLLVIKLVVDRYYSPRTVILLTILISFLIGIGLQTNQFFKFLIFSLLLAGAKNVNLKKLLRYHGVVLAVIMLSVFVGLKLGVISDITHWAREGKFLRHTLGFRFTTFGPNMLFHFLCIWGYIRGKKISWLELIFLAGANQYYFMYTDTKSAYYFSLLLLALLAFIKIFKPNFSENKLIWFERVALVICTVIPIFTIYLYENRTPFLIQLNNFLTGRVYLGYVALITYKIPLLGQPIIWNTPDIFGNISGAFLYVDSSFMNMLLNFGVIFLALLLASIWVLSKKNPYRNLYYSLSFIIVLLHAMWDPQFLEIWYNPFLLFLAVLVSQSPKDIERAGLENK
ncbi:TPA: hypothetical protein ACGORU_000310 [Streptococcus suis]